VKKKSDSTDWKRLVKNYNRLVQGFRSTWGLLGAIVLVYPRKDAEVDIAKQRIVELQKRITKVERSLKKRQTENMGKQIKSLTLELRIFRELMDKIDVLLSPLDIRKFCEKTHDTRDAEIRELLRFYLERETFADEDLDKIDLLATALCSSRVGHKRVLRNLHDVDQTLGEIFSSPVPVVEYEKPIIDEFKQAVQRIHNTEEVEDLIEDEVIHTMREFKKEIREQLANPRILKAMVAYNVALNNRLIEIFEREAGGISSSSEWAEKTEAELDKTPPEHQNSVRAILEKIEEIRRSFIKKKEQTGYNLDLIIEAAKQRKAISKSIDRIKEIREPTPPPKDNTFQRKTTQVLINEVFRALLGMEDTTGDSCFMPEMNVDVAKLDPWEKGMFIVDLDALGEERRLFEAVQEAIILRYKILQEYKQGKHCLSREEITGLIGENLEVANQLNDELQVLLDRFDPRKITAIKVIDLMKVKSGLAKSIKRLISMSRMEGFMG